MDPKNFTSKFIKFYKDEFIYLDTESLRFDTSKNMLQGLLKPHTPAYRRRPIKDKILTNTESMFCANQILYAVHFYHHYHHTDHNLETYARVLLDSYLMVDMHFHYNAHIETAKPVPFAAHINVGLSKTQLVRTITKISIGEQDNFLIEAKGYIVTKKMHEA